MKQSLQLKLGQSLTMTPQLQQAIRLLQLSSLELQTEIQEILESNPLLEVSEDSNNDNTDTDSNEKSAAADNADTTDRSRSEDSNDSDGVNDSEIAAQSGEGDIDTSSDVGDIPDDLPVDSSWEDTYDYAPSRASSDDSDQRNYEQPSSVGESLAHHLDWQMINQHPNP